MSNFGDKKEIDEIIVKYQLEPSLNKEIYVEGSSDKSLIEWFLKQAGIRNIIVLEISTVNIKSQRVINLGLDTNNKNRIISLCDSIQNGIIGIIDSDFDFLEIPKYTYPHLFRTDYASMEGYCFNVKILEKILLGHISKQVEDYNSLLKVLGDILVELFLIRFSKEKLQKNNKYLTFDKKKYLSSTNNQLYFNRTLYLQNYFSNKQEIINEINKFIDKQKLSLPSDIRKVIHGHDFEDLLLFYLNITQKDAKEIFKRSLYSALEYESLKKENMFIKLLQALEMKDTL